MYLVERVAGGAVYLALMLVVCNGITVSRKSSVKKWLIAYAILLGLLGFIYIPPETADLTRLLESYRVWLQLPFDEILARCSTSSTPAQVLYFWVVGQTGLDGALPGVSGFLYHLLIFSCIWDFAQRRDMPQPAVAVAVAFLMSFGSFLQAISGVRSYLAFAVIARCMYREIACSRPVVLSIPGYLFACLMHPAGMALTIVRLAILIFQKGGGVLRKAGIVAFIAVAVAFASRFGAQYIDSMFDKMTGYFGGEVYSYVWEYLIHGILLASIAGTLYSGRSLFAEDDAERNLALGVGVTAFIAVAFAPIEYSVFLRFSGFSACLCAPLVMRLLKQRYEDGDANYRSWLLVAICAMAFIACARGDLSGYKFMVL